VFVVPGQLLDRSAQQSTDLKVKNWARAAHFRSMDRCLLTTLNDSEIRESRDQAVRIKTTRGKAAPGQASGAIFFALWRHVD